MKPAQPGHKLSLLFSLLASTFVQYILNSIDQKLIFEMNEYYIYCVEKFNSWCTINTHESNAKQSWYDIDASWRSKRGSLSSNIIITSPTTLSSPLILPTQDKTHLRERERERVYLLLLMITRRSRFPTTLFLCWC